MENQVIEGDKQEKNVSTSIKRHKELMEDIASEEVLGENQESSTEICHNKTETCKKIEVGKQHKPEENKEKDGKWSMTWKNMKNSNSGVSRNKRNENETNIHKKPKGIKHTAYHSSNTRKESRNKELGSTDERKIYQMNEKGAKR